MYKRQPLCSLLKTGAFLRNLSSVFCLDITWNGMKITPIKIHINFGNNLIDMKILFHLDSLESQRHFSVNRLAMRRENSYFNF